ncbi:FeS-binding protein [Thermotoga sp. KOL6]|nr:FeS-binding protein [Thermotoga sp. KOL6]
MVKVTRVEEVCEELKVPLTPLDDPIEVNGEIFRKIKISRKVLEADKVVNLPKFKTHSQMVMTLGVKNTFGCVTGLEKSSWHMRAKNYDDFANLLIDIHRIVSPILTVLDGIEGMEGNGPTNGRKKNFGIIAVSRNAFALDDAICSFLGIDHLVYTVKNARRRMVTPEYEVFGSFSSTIQLPSTVSTFERFSRAFSRFFVKYPSIDKRRCIKCRLCEERCPASAIDISKQEIDYQKCIRCYVCHEVCPQNAIKLVRKLI